MAYDVAQAYVQILPSTEKFGSTLKSELNSSTEDAGRDAGGKFASGLKTGLKVAGVALAAAGAGAVKLTSEVIGAYGEYEQLVGGVQKLFGEMDYQAVVDNAADAFKTAGLSSNDYMETVTSFSASLIQSLGGDTQKAVDYADKAITDMSDNANVFGTDMASIQYAYQGFAKQNYSMLDNLKLGYAGSRTEMERLITDAEQLDSTFQATRDTSGNLTLSFSDIVDAIHIVQENMEITGTTAKEASETIEGSISSMKGAWENLLTGMGDSDADIGKLTDDFVQAFENVVENIEPVIQNVSKALPEVLGSIMDVAAEILPDLIVDLLPSVVSGLTKLVAGLITHLPEILLGIGEGLIDGISEAITGEKTGLFDASEKFGEMLEGMRLQVDDLRNTIDSLDESYANNVTGIQDNATAAGFLIDEIAALEQVEGKSAEQKSLMATYVSQLNELMPGLNLEYDAERDALSKTVPELESYVELKTKEAELAAASEYLTEAVKNQAEAERQRKDTLENIMPVLDDYGISWEDLSDAITRFNATDNGLEKINIMRELFSESGISAKEAEDAFRDLFGAYYDTMGAQLNYTDACEQVEEAQNELKEKTAELTQETGEDLSLMGALYQETFGTSIPTALDDAINSATTAGIQIPSTLIDGLASGDIEMSNAINRMNALVSFDSAIENAGLDGVEVSQSFIDSWLSGEFSLVDANNYLQSLIDFSNAITEASNSGTELTTEFVNGMISEAGLEGVVSAADVIAEHAKPSIVVDEVQTVGASVPQEVANGMSSNETVVTDTAAQMASDIVSEFDTLPSEMNASGSESGSNLNSGFGDWQSTISGTVDSTYQFFYDTLGTMLPPLMSTWGSNSAQKFNSGLNLWATDIATTASDFNTSVYDGVKGLPATMSTVGSQAGQGFYNGLAGWAASISAKAYSIANSVRNAARQALDIHSPSKVMTDIGEEAGAGIVVGIDNSTDSVVASAENMATAAASAVNDTLDGMNAEIASSVIGANVQTDVNNVLSGTANMDANVVGTGSIISILANMYNAIVALSKTNLVMDTGQVVGALAEPMNKAFAQIHAVASRG